MDLDTITEDWINQTNMGNTIEFMRQTGFHQWGFVIYRAAHANDNLWDRYLAALKDNVRQNLQRNNCDELLQQYIQWTVFNTEVDKSTKNDARRHFASWCNENSVEHDVRSPLPRFNYCLYVDQKCMETLEAHAQGKLNLNGAGLGSPLPPLVAAIIDVKYLPTCMILTFGCHLSFVPIEECPGRYVGWEYYDTAYLPLLYDKLHVEPLDKEETYFRPPGIAPGGNLALEFLE